MIPTSLSATSRSTSGEGRARPYLVRGMAILLVIGIVCAVVWNSNTIFAKSEGGRKIELMRDSKKMMAEGQLVQLKMDVTVAQTVRAEMSKAGFSEALYCGYDSAGTFFWNEALDIGLTSLVNAVKLGGYKIRLVDGNTLKYVESSTTGANSPNALLKAGDFLNHVHVSSSSWVAQNWVGDAALLQQMQFSCMHNNLQGPTSSEGGIYWACGNQNGLHVWKDFVEATPYNKMCTWNNNVRTNQNFFLYYQANCA